MSPPNGARSLLWALFFSVYDASPVLPVRPIRTRPLLHVRLHFLAGLCAVVLPSLSVAAISELPRLQGEITLDGILADGEWEHAVRVDLGFETDPAENRPAPVKTTAFLIEDGENLFVAFAADDPDPQAIRAFLRDRDRAWSDDRVGIVLDTYNDERRAFEFHVNPLGVQMDKTFDDVAGGNSWDIDDSWDAIWDAAGRIHDGGYIVEMRIPLSQLRFPDVAGTKTWGYDLVRIYPRDLTYELSNNRIDRDRNCYLCQLGKLQGLEGSRPSRDLEIVPTLTATQNETTDEPGVEPLRRGDPDAEVGLTVRWGITPDLTANITLNPDFSQVETDVAQLDVNNRFTLFYPEKRPFFLEGADYFSTPIRAVYTRTVAAPEFGAKLTGKKGDHTFGLFAAEDDVTSLLFPGLYSSDTELLEQSNTAFVGRYSRGFDNTSLIGTLVSLRAGDEYHNYVGGIDGRWQINDQHTIDFQYLQSETQYPLATALEFEQPLDAFSGNAALVEYEYESRDWRGGIEYYDYSGGFRADSGFETTVGNKLTQLRFGRVFYGEDDSWWSRIRTFIVHETQRSEDGELAERSSSLRFGIGGGMQTWLQLTLLDSSERDEGVLYELNRARVYFEIQPAGSLWLSAVAVYGDQIDYTNSRLGKRRSISPNATWNITRALQLRVDGVYSRLETPDGEQIFDAALADTRLTWQFNLRSFLRLTFQYQRIKRNPDVYLEPTDAREKDIGRELLYSYKLNPQTVIFLGYTDRFIDDDTLNGLEPEDRTIFMKFGYAWTP